MPTTPDRSVPPIRPAAHAVSRRTLLFGGLALGTLAACDATTGSADGGATTSAPADTTRIAALDPRTMDILVALNCNVVGGQPAGTGIGIPAYLKQRARGQIAMVGDGNNIDVEKLVAVEPDLAVGFGDFAKILPQLQQVAPVKTYESALFTAKGAVDWRPDIRSVGRLIGRERDAEALVSTLADRFAQTRSRITGKQGNGIAIMRVYGTEGFRLYAAGSVPTVIMADTGLQLAKLPAEPPAGRFLAEFSPERVLDVTADHIFVSIGNFDQPSTPEEFAALESNPLWQRVPAVKAGHVGRITDESAWFMGGPIGWQAMLDQVDEYFTKQ